MSTLRLGIVVFLSFAFGVFAQEAAAANKTATLVPPATANDVESVCFYKAAANKARVVIDACASDATTGAKDCATVTQVVDTVANANASALYTLFINAWKTAKGY